MASKADVCVGQDWPGYRIQALHLAEYQQVSTLSGHFSFPLFSQSTPLDVGFYNCRCDVNVTRRPPIWLTLQRLCTPIPHRCLCDSFVLLSLPLNVLLSTKQQHCRPWARAFETEQAIYNPHSCHQIQTWTSLNSPPYFSRLFWAKEWNPNALE